MAVNYSEEEVEKAHKVLYNEGLKMRYKVAGKEYVDRSLKAADNPFARSMQEVSPALLPHALSVATTDLSPPSISTLPRHAGVGFGLAQVWTSRPGVSLTSSCCVRRTVARSSRHTFGAR